MIKQSKPFLGIFKGSKLVRVVQSPGTTTFYSPDIYTHLEADTFDKLLLGKVKPTDSEMDKLFESRHPDEVANLKNVLKVTKGVK